jgi:hypothetical protein
MPVQVVYYVRVGEHGGFEVPTFSEALIKACSIAVAAALNDPDTWYVGVEAEEEFAILLLKEQYLNLMDLRHALGTTGPAISWRNAAKKYLEAGEVQHGRW